MTEDKTFSHIALPLDTHPREFDWTVLEGLEVAILYFPEDCLVLWESMERLAVMLVRAGASRVFLLDHEYRIKTYQPSGAMK